MYQEQAHLLDPHLESITQPIMMRLRSTLDRCSHKKEVVPETTINLFRFLYLLTKTRGYKTIGILLSLKTLSVIYTVYIIVKFMTHEVTDLEPVFDFLSQLNPADTHLWEVRYISLIWLSLICMIPFDLKKVDSAINPSEV